MAAPDPDGRRREDLREEAAAMAPYYTDEWDPDADGPGATLLRLFAELAEEVTERVDRVPEKHRVAFYDRLGFDQAPPSAARLPLSITLADGVSENVPVPAGTRAVGGAPEQPFEVLAEDAFEATPARLTDALSVAPEPGEIYEHDALLDGGEATLFDGESGSQRHLLHVGHAGQLAVDGTETATTIRVEVATEVPTATLASDLEWAFYGERDGESDWHVVEATAAGSRPGPDRGVPRRQVDLTVDGAVGETPVDGVESRWLRCRLRSDAWDADHFGVRFGDPQEADPDAPPLAVGPVQSGSVPTDALLASGTEIAVDGADPVAPLGKEPRPQDAFYVGCAEAFTKAGATVEVELAAGPNAAIDRSRHEDPEIAWEYWDGDAWSRLGVTPVDDTGSPIDDEATAAEVRNLRRAGTVAFTVADDHAATSVAGHDGHWIRARLTSGAYGSFEATETETTTTTNGETSTSTTWSTVHQVSPPAFAGVTVRFARDALAPADHLVAENNLAFGPDLVAAGRHRFRPFVGLPDDRQALYLGFDRPLEGGPINVLFALEEVQYEAGFYPRVQWERRTPDGRWVRIDTTDPTESLTERGIVGLAFEEPTIATARFGRACHWVRARVTDARFEPGSDGAANGEGEEKAEEATDDPVEGTASSGGTGDHRSGEAADVAGERGATGLRASSATAEHALDDAVRRDADGVLGVALGRSTVRGPDVDDLPEIGPRVDPFVDPRDPPPWMVERDRHCPVPEPCGRTVQTEPPAGQPARDPPTVTGLYPNTGWAHNVRTIEAELLGSSDGTRDQTVAVSTPPAIDAEVWVDELAALSAGRREAVAASPAFEVETDTGPDGEPTAFWVRWTRVESFLDSGGDDRHYTLDASAGEVAFGDGTRGRIPPPGRNNVRATYRTGGGTAGNVPAGAIGELTSAIPFVDAVTNPIPADGGADEETVDGVLDRAPKAIRDRGRAVTEVDVERIALDASRELARARCISGMDRDGDHAPGWVTLLVVPGAPAEKPVPSVTLREQVRSAVAERAAATLVADPDQLVVRGPSYVPVAVEASIVTAGVGSRSRLEAAATAAVADFLNPLDGGPEGEGWSFGEVPCHSDLYSLLEGVDGVDHVEDLVLAIGEGSGAVRVREGDPEPSTSADALVHSGRHELRATGTDRQGGG